MLRNDPRYAAVPVDDLLVQRLRDAIAGKANDAELAAPLGETEMNLTLMRQIDEQFLETPFFGVRPPPVTLLRKALPGSG